jgi:hypothetical protein
MKSLAKEIAELEKMKLDIQKRMWKFSENNCVGGSKTRGTIKNGIENDQQAAELEETAAGAIQTSATPKQRGKNKTSQTSPTERYWEVHEKADKEHCKLFLRMFAPGSGVLSKPQTEQWKIIRDKVLPQLTQLSFGATHEKLGLRLVQAEIELNQLKDADVPEDIEDGDADADEDGDKLQD